MLLSSYGAARGPAYLDATGIAAGREESSSHPAREDSAPPASRDYLKAQAAPPYLRAPPEQLGGLPSSQELASGRPNLEESPLSTTRYEENIVCEEMQPGYTLDGKLVRAAYVMVSTG